MIQGGGDLSWTKPVSPADEVVGAHRGHHAALNIKNPQPGFRYYYERRDANKVLVKKNEGWEVVQANSPERWGDNLPEDVQKELDGVRAYQDVILLRIPEEKYRQNREHLRELAEASRRGSDREYLDKSREREHQLGVTDREVYYARATHGTRTQEF